MITVQKTKVLSMLSTGSDMQTVAVMKCDRFTFAKNPEIPEILWTAYDS